MPIIIDKNSPVFGQLTGRRVFVLDKERAAGRTINGLEIAILNVFPFDGQEETEIMRILGNTPLDLNVTLVCPYKEAADGGILRDFYTPFSRAEAKKFDGMIVTGAPPASDRFFIKNEFRDILLWADANVNSTLYTAWSARAALNVFYGIKRPKKSGSGGLYQCKRIFDGADEPLMRGISDEFCMPHSGRDFVYAKDVMFEPGLKICAYSKRAGACIIKSADMRRVFVTGHMEYGRYALKEKFEKSLKEGVKVKPPVNYFSGDGGEVKMNWSSTAYLFYLNWLNCCIFRGENEAFA